MVFIGNIPEIKLTNLSQKTINNKNITIIFIIYIGFTLLNIILAGYIPLFNLLVGLDSGYLNFGVSGLYGLYNAYANSIGICSFYLWINYGHQRSRSIFFIILIVFILLVSRQNILTLLIESFIIFNLTRRRISNINIFIILIITILLFGFLGDLRSQQNIRELAKIYDYYDWLPNSLIWLYSYFYFNILNLDNIIYHYPFGVMDFSSLSQLLPSFIRPKYPEMKTLLEVPQFTVATFIAPIFKDFGLSGLIVYFVFFCTLINFYMKRLRESPDMNIICGYSVIYFCCLFSFFDNFWFYLPVIFQLFFLYIFTNKILFK
jgi:oligosaccharide repeat unit polymerase